MSIAYLTHRACSLHQMGDYHPEQPARLSAINDQLIESGLEMVLMYPDVPVATQAQLLRVHDADYVQHVFDSTPSEGQVWFDADTAMGRHTLEAALRAAGAAVRAVDLVIQGEANQAFCAVRPPGHHAEHARAMGFCFFNNVAVGAAHALSEYGLERVAIEQRSTTRILHGPALEVPDRGSRGPPEEGRTQV